jgi:biopolymer transport protein ExbD
MPLKCTPLEEPAPNLTSMIDVAFLLLVFFMVGTRFDQEDREQQLDVQLPTVSAAQPLTEQPDELVVNVYQDGRIFLGKVPKKLPELVQELERARKRYVDQSVVIRGEGEGKYQAVVDVLIACHKAKIKHFSLATVIKADNIKTE